MSEMSDMRAKQIDDFTSCFLFMFIVWFLHLLKFDLQIEVYFVQKKKKKKKTEVYLKVNLSFYTQIPYFGSFVGKPSNKVMQN